MPKQNIKGSKNDSQANIINCHTSYVIDGKHFDVERVFNDEASDSLGMVLLKLIKAEIAPF